MTVHRRIRCTSPFIVWPTSIIVLVVIYFASFGPFSWLLWSNTIPIQLGERINSTVYLPIFELYRRGYVNDYAIGRAYWTYVSMWVNDAVDRRGSPRV
jgi:hypothetical protein